MTPDLPSPESFFVLYRREITALITIVLAFAIAQTLDRAFARRGSKLTQVVAGGEITQAADTRIRLVRRLVYALVVLIGIALALSQFDAVRRTATGILASSAVLGIVVGFAARQTLANAIAGIQLAITQPIRVGDLVTFEEHTGTVEDVRLSYTYVHADDGGRVIIPNERLASSTIQNHTIMDPRMAVEVSVWLSPQTDAGRALEVLGEDDDLHVYVAEVEKDGVRLGAWKYVHSTAERADVAAGLRAWALERLRSEGLSSNAGVAGLVESSESADGSPTAEAPPPSAGPPT